MIARYQFEAGDRVRLTRDVVTNDGHLTPAGLAGVVYDLFGGAILVDLDDGSTMILYAAALATDFIEPIGAAS